MPTEYKMREIKRLLKIKRKLKKEQEKRDSDKSKQTKLI